MMMSVLIPSKLFRHRYFSPRTICETCRTLTTTSILSSGHSRWSTIKHDKAKNDRAKSKERQVLTNDIVNASQMWGPDPNFNPRLQLAISKAKAAHVPKASIDLSIARGQGTNISGQALEPLTIEAMWPGSIGAVIECLTDNKARVLQDLRRIIKDFGGNITPTTFLFEKRGRIIFERKDGLNADDYLELAIEAGATDVQSDDKGRLVIYTEPTETKHVAENFAKSTDLVVERSEIIWDPNKDTTVKPDEEVAQELEEALTVLRDDPSVRDVYINTAESF